MENIELIFTIIVSITTVIGTIKSIGAFKKQKEHENAETAFKDFYIPALKLLENHLYISKKADLKKASFINAKTAINKLMDEQYIYVPFNLQDSFKAFENSTEENKLQEYNKFCDCFINGYRESSKACGMKPITVGRRNKLGWYSSKRDKILSNLKVFAGFIYSLFVVITVWMLAMYILAFILDYFALAK